MLGGCGGERGGEGERRAYTQGTIDNGVIELSQNTGHN